MTVELLKAAKQAPAPRLAGGMQTKQDAAGDFTGLIALLGQLSEKADTSAQADADGAGRTPAAYGAQQIVSPEAGPASPASAIQLMHNMLVESVFQTPEAEPDKALTPVTGAAMPLLQPAGSSASSAEVAVSLRKGVSTRDADSFAFHERKGVIDGVIVQRAETHTAPFMQPAAAKLLPGKSAADTGTKNTALNAAGVSPAFSLASAESTRGDMPPVNASVPNRDAAKPVHDHLPKPAPSAPDAKAVHVPAGTFTPATPQGQIADAITATLGPSAPATLTATESPAGFSALASRATVRTLQIELYPASLGIVTVTLTLHDDGVRVAVSAADAGTAALLAGDTKQISDSLSHAGYTVDAVTIQATPRAEIPGEASRTSGDAASGGHRDETQKRPGERQHQDERQTPHQSQDKKHDPARRSPHGVYV